MTDWVIEALNDIHHGLIGGIPGKCSRCGNHFSREGGAHRPSCIGHDIQEIIWER